MRRIKMIEINEEELERLAECEIYECVDKWIKSVTDLNDKEKAFLKEYYNINDINILSKDEYNELQEKLVFIDYTESRKLDNIPPINDEYSIKWYENNCSQLGQMASGIVTFMSNHRPKEVKYLE